MCPVTRTQFESLSNELLLEVFEYLDVLTVYEAFHGLNRRIDTLLQQGKLELRIDSERSSELLSTIVPAFFKPSQIRVFMSNHNNNNADGQLLSFTDQNLYSLRLRMTKEDDLHEILQNLPQNNQIKCLHIYDSHAYRQIESRDVGNIIFIEHAEHFKSLICLSVWFYRHNQFPAISTAFPRLRRLSIVNCSWSLELLQFLHDSTPNLRSLRYVGYTYLTFQLSKIVLGHIQELHLDLSDDVYNMALILNSFPCLRRLHVKWQGREQGVAYDGVRWQQLIENCVPALKQLTLEYAIGVDQNIVKSFYGGAFWSTKKVSVALTTDKLQFRCPLVKAIYFGVKWRFEYFDQYEM